MIASAEQLAALRDGSPDTKAALSPETFPPAEVERGLRISAANPALAPMVLQEADDILGRLRGLGTARDAIDERRRMFRTEVRDAVLNRASETDPRGALEAFKSGGYAELFDGDDEDGRKAWEGHLTQAAVTRDDDDAWERERGELENRQMKGLAAVMFRAEREQAIRSGDVSGAKITQAVKSGLIGREEGEQLRQAALARKDELRETSQRMTALMDRTRADEEFEPDEETARMVDDWYDTVARPAWDLLPDDQRRAQEESLVRRTGILPAARAGELRRGLNSDDPETVIASAEQLAALRDASPDMEAALNPEAFPPAEVERGLRIADGIKAGHPPEKVLEAVGENEIAIRVPKGRPGPGGKTRGPKKDDDGPPPAPPVPLPGGGTGEGQEDTGRRIPGSPRQTGDFRRDAREFQEFLRTEKVLEPADPDEFGQPRDVSTETANEEHAEGIRNRRSEDRRNEAVEPAYQVGQPVYDFKIGDKSDLEFVRVTARNGGSSGGFIMRRQDYERILEDGGPAAVRDAWSLPVEPELVLPVNPADTRLRVGIAAANQFGSGGGLQFELLDELRRSWFGKPVEIGRSND